ncbi:hypothetical protein IHE44_0011201, partial [Lamprotornis superbus]
MYMVLEDVTEFEITPEGRRITKLDQILLNGNNITMKSKYLIVLHYLVVDTGLLQNAIQGAATCRIAVVAVIFSSTAWRFVRSMAANSAFNSRMNLQITSECETQLRDYKYLPAVHAETFLLRTGTWPGPKQEWERAQAVLQEQQGSR